MLNLGINGAFPSYFGPQPWCDRRFTVSAPRKTAGTGVIGPNGWPVGPCGHSANYYLDPDPAEYMIIITKGAAKDVKVVQPSDVQGGGVNISRTFDSNGIVKFTAAGYLANSIAINVNTTDPDETRWTLVRTDEYDVWKADPAAYSPSWLKRYTDAGFTQFRFMDWMKTNDNTSTAYVERDIYSNFQAMAGGVPLSMIVKFCVATGISPWIPIPVRATDDEVRSIVSRCSLLTSVGIVVRFELGNEVWNASFAARSYAIAQEALLYPADDPKLLTGQRWYGYRAAQISKVIQDAGWILRKHFKMVLAGQTVSSGNLAKALTGVALAGGDVPSRFTTYAITNYIWGQLTSAYEVTVPLVRSGNLAGGFDSLMNAPYPALSVASMKTILPNVVASAQKAQFDEVDCYEGNIHNNTLSHFSTANLTKNGYIDVTQEQVGTYFANLQRDPGMVPVMEALLKVTEDAGISTVNLFNDYGKFGLNGCFGLYGTPLWDAIVKFIADRKPSADLLQLAQEVDAMQQQLDTLTAKVKAAIGS